MEQNILYLGNVLSQCTETDIYKLFEKFGQIKRINILSETFQGIDYPVGFALIEFADRNSYNKCINEKNNMQFQTSIIHVHQQKPDTRFGVSVFVFFNDDNVTRDTIFDFFENIRPVDVRIKNEVGASYLGFAIVEFSSIDAKELALGLAENAPFNIVAPSQKCIDLSYSGIPERSLSFIPDRTPILNNPLYGKFLDFEILHNETPYSVNSFLAAAYSSRIHHELLSNSCLSRIKMRINDEGDFYPVCCALLGQTIEVNESNANFIFLMAADLGISFLMEAATGFILSKMTPEKALEFTNKLTSYLGDTIITDGPHIRFMAAHLSEMRKKIEFQGLPLEVISAVLHNPLLNVGEVDTFCAWLIEFVKRNPDERMRLLQFLRFDSKYRSRVERLIKDDKFNININLIRGPLLKMMNAGVTNEKSKKEVIHCRYKPDSEDYGVFAMFSERCCGNPQDFNIVNVTSNTLLPKIIEPNWKDWWSTPNEANSWILFDFRNYKLKPTGYALKSLFSDIKLPYMKSWRIEGSNDEAHWEILNEQRNSNTGTEVKQWHKWEVITNKEFRYIRLTQTDRNGTGNYCLFLFGIEFYGHLSSNDLSIDINYTSGKDLKGVFDFLTQKCRMNPVLKNEIEIKSSCDPKFLIEKSWKGCWRSPKVPNSWVLIEFIDTKIVLMSYSLKTHYGPAYIRSWDVEVSNDKETWYTVDSHVKVDEYKNPYTSLHWICASPQPDPMKYVRFVMTGPSSRNENIFWLSNIELFGDIFPDN